MALRFGTDGLRGPADELSDSLVGALGQAAAAVLGGMAFVIGRDTRESGGRIEGALAAGLARAGVAPEALGTVPTPVVAFVCARRGLPGAMISASHNPFGDNGIKFFAAGGLKLSDEVEAALEAALDHVLGPAESSGRGPAAGGVAPAPADEVEADLSRYRQAVIDSIEGRSLTGLRVVVDCANGSASQIAPDVLRRLGADVEVIHADPDGRNINHECGSTHPGDLQAAVVASGATAGLAFDGDADRVVAVDERGDLVDGDHVIALCAIDLRARARLTDNAVVVTVMTNLGFRLAMAGRGIEVVETNVGDRCVLEALEQRGLALGGEQSGHVIFRRLATTGDGLLTGVQLLDLLARSGRPLSALSDEAMTRLPQVLDNVRVVRADPRIVESVAAEIAAAERELGATGRVLVRPSGTEPLVRVMVEAPEQTQAQAVADRLVAAVRRVAGDDPA